MKTVRAYQCVNCGKMDSDEAVWLEVHFQIEMRQGYRHVEIHDDGRYGDGQSFCTFNCAGKWLEKQVRPMPPKREPEPEPATPPPAEDLVAVLKDIAAPVPEVVF